MLLLKNISFNMPQLEIENRSGIGLNPLYVLKLGPVMRVPAAFYSPATPGYQYGIPVFLLKLYMFNQ